MKLKSDTVERICAFENDVINDENIIILLLTESILVILLSTLLIQYIEYRFHKHAST